RPYKLDQTIAMGKVTALIVLLSILCYMVTALPMPETESVAKRDTGYLSGFDTPLMRVILSPFLAWAWVTNKIQG
ncbi:hypothetical protein ElyMa_005600700, partial [Elysia marginata]